MAGIFFQALLNGNFVLEPSGRPVWNAKVTYACDPGFRLSPQSSQTQTCGEDGFWTGSVPASCHRIQCPKLAAPENGLMMGASHLFGDSVRFGCVPGYELFGQGVLRCGESGNWNASVPTCQGTKKETFGGGIFQRF